VVEEGFFGRLSGRSRAASSREFPKKQPEVVALEINACAHTWKKPSTQTAK